VKVTTDNNSTKNFTAFGCREGELAVLEKNFEDKIEK